MEANGGYFRKRELVTPPPPPRAPFGPKVERGKIGPGRTRPPGTNGMPRINGVDKIGNRASPGSPISHLTELQSSRGDFYKYTAPNGAQFELNLRVPTRIRGIRKAGHLTRYGRIYGGTP